MPGVTRDTSIPVGNRLDGAPQFSGSVWTTYQFDEGYLARPRAGPPA